MARTIMTLTEKEIDAKLRAALASKGITVLDTSIRFTYDVGAQWDPGTGASATADVSLADDITFRLILGEIAIKKLLVAALKADGHAIATNDITFSHDSGGTSSQPSEGLSATIALSK